MSAIPESVRKSIESKVKELEKVSCAEFVPFFVRRSSHYRAFRLVLSLLATLAQLATQRYFSFDHGLALEIGLPILSGVLVYGLTRFSLIFRLLMPDVLFLEHVELCARLAFSREEVFATRSRSGILIYISEFERAVFILADRGIEKALSADEIRQLGERLAGDFQVGQAGDTFVTALEALRPKLEKHLPAHAGDMNELSDRVRTD